MQSSTVPSISELQNKWDGFAQLYTRFDSANQASYYSLIHMLKLDQAQHILEVACGSARFIPLALAIKPSSCTYTAVDLSSAFIKIAHQTLQAYLYKMGVEKSLDAWLKFQNIQLLVANGQDPIEVGHKFDRIICNLVVNVTQNAQKMMNSLASVSKQGCLLGLSIWGDKSLQSMYTIADKARAALNKPSGNARSNFHLYNKVPQLASKTGWQVLLQWQQDTAIHQFQVSAELQQLFDRFAGRDEQVKKWSWDYVKESFKAKKALKFPVQCVLLRKQ